MVCRPPGCRRCRRARRGRSPSSAVPRSLPDRGGDGRGRADGHRATDADAARPLAHRDALADRGPDSDAHAATDRDRDEARRRRAAGGAADGHGHRAPAATATATASSVPAPTPTAPLANPPWLVLATQSLAFGVEVGPRTLSFTNPGGAPLAWRVVADSTWIDVSQVSGTLPPGGTQSVAVGIARGDLPTGGYDGVIQIISDGGEGLVPVTMAVSPSNTTISAFVEPSTPINVLGCPEPTIYPVSAAIGGIARRRRRRSTSRRTTARSGRRSCWSRGRGTTARSWGRSPSRAGWFIRS
ncbi:MAG: hypothetical protein U0232_04790 [Thermomicrobiales bacterium]